LFANLGDFAGPGTRERHERDLSLVDALPFSSICVLGNHDLDGREGWETFECVHNAATFDFAHGNTRFVAVNCQPSTDGPRDEGLDFLDSRFHGDDHPNRVVLMHMPPSFGGRYAPHAEWGVTWNEREFLDLVRRLGVKLVCCAHVAYDTHVHRGKRYVVFGGGGTALCLYLAGACLGTTGSAPERGSFDHVVEITVDAAGRMAGRVFRAFEEARSDPAYVFRH